MGYNGWSNYPTWYMSLDLVPLIAEMAIDQGEVDMIDEDYVESYIDNVFLYNGDYNDNFVEEAVSFFLGEVNYRELAEAVKEAAQY